MNFSLDESDLHFGYVGIAEQQALSDEYEFAISGNDKDNQQKADSRYGGRCSYPNFFPWKT